MVVAVSVCSDDRVAAEESGEAWTLFGELGRFELRTDVSIGSGRKRLRGGEGAIRSYSPWYSRKRGKAGECFIREKAAGM